MVIHSDSEWCYWMHSFMGVSGVFAAYLKTQILHKISLQDNHYTFVVNVFLTYLIFVHTYSMSFVFFLNKGAVL